MAKVTRLPPRDPPGGEPPELPPNDGDLPRYYIDPAVMHLLGDLPFKDRARALAARRQGRKDKVLIEEMALFLQLKGYTDVQISTELECSTTHVKDLIKRAIERRRPQLDRALQEHIDEQIMQIDSLINLHWPMQQIEPRHGEVIVKLLDRKAKLLGMDKPTKVEITEPPKPVAFDIDTSVLPVHELRELRRIMALAQELQAAATAQRPVIDLTPDPVALPAPDKPQ